MTTSQPNGLAPATVCHPEMHKHVLKLRAQGPILRRGWQAQERQYTMLQIMSTNVSEEDKVTRVCVVLANSGKAPQHVLSWPQRYLSTACVAMRGGPAPTQPWTGAVCVQRTAKRQSHVRFAPQFVQGRVCYRAVGVYSSEGHTITCNVVKGIPQCGGSEHLVGDSNCPASISFVLCLSGLSLSTWLLLYCARDTS